MSRRTRLAGTALAVAVLLASALPALAAKDKGRAVDLVTVAPDFAAHHLRSIALLPVVSYDHSQRAEKMTASYWSQNFKDTGYRWIAPLAVEVMLKAPGDSALTALRAGILKNARVDSLDASPLCARLNADALLSVRLNQWEQAQVNYDQSGKPMTTVRLQAALVDSSGALLWSAVGSETGEGPYHDPNANPMEVKQHPNLIGTPITGAEGPPPYEEVLNRLLPRLAAQFPKAAAVPEAAR